MQKQPTAPGVPGWAGSLGSAPAWGQEQETLPACFDSELLWACPGALLGSSLDPLGPTQDLPLQGPDPTFGGELTSVASRLPKGLQPRKGQAQGSQSQSQRREQGEWGCFRVASGRQLSSSLPHLTLPRDPHKFTALCPWGQHAAGGRWHPCRAQSCPISGVGLWTSTMTALTIPSQEHLYTLRDVLELGCHFETPSKAL